MKKNITWSLLSNILICTSLVALEKEEHKSRKQKLAHPYQQRTTLNRHTNSVTAIAYNHAGTQLASASYDETIKIWHLEFKPICRATLKGHQHIVQAVTYLPNDKQLVSGSVDTTIKLWDIATSKCVITLPGAKDAHVQSLTYNKTHNLLAAAYLDGRILMWDMRTKKEAASIKHVGWTNAVQFNPESTVVACACDNSIISLWDTKKWLPLGKLEGHKRGVTGLVWKSDDHLISASKDTTVALWNMRSKERTHVLEDDLTPITAMVAGTSACEVITASHNGIIKIWNTDTRQCLETFANDNDPVVAVAKNPVTEEVATAHQDNNSVTVWHKETSCKEMLKPQRTETDIINAMLDHMHNERRNALIKLVIKHQQLYEKAFDAYMTQQQENE